MHSTNDSSFYQYRNETLLRKREVVFFFFESNLLLRCGMQSPSKITVWSNTVFVPQLSSPYNSVLNLIHLLPRSVSAKLSLG